MARWLSRMGLTNSLARGFGFGEKGCRRAMFGAGQLAGGRGNGGVVAALDIL